MTPAVADRVLAGLILLGTGTLCGQDYPNKPVRIVTSAPGGGSDFAARIIAQGISGPLAQPAIVDNRSAFFATSIVADAPPDGYVLLLAASSFLVEPLLKKSPYDPLKDFA